MTPWLKKEATLKYFEAAVHASSKRLPPTTKRKGAVVIFAWTTNPQKSRRKDESHLRGQGGGGAATPALYEFLTHGKHQSENELLLRRGRCHKAMRNRAPKHGADQGADIPWARFGGSLKEVTLRILYGHVLGQTQGSVNRDESGKHVESLT